MDELLNLLQSAVLPLTLALMLIWVIVAWSRRSRTSPADGDDGSDDADLCAACGYDVRGGLDRCPECGRPTGATRRRRVAALREAVPAAPITRREPGVDEQQLVLGRTVHADVAHVLRDHLEARGIAVRLTRETKPAAGRTTRRYRLSVWAGDKAEAADLVDRLWPVSTAAPPADGLVAEQP